jgi:hypothetical protein
MIAQKAIFALEQLDKAKITSQADRNGLVQILGEPRHRLGDKWVSIRKDDYTGNVISKEEIKVDRIEAGLVYASSNTGLNYIYTLDGGVLRSNAIDNTFTYDPPLTNLPGDELAIGKKWSNTTIQTNKVRSNLRKDEYKVIAFEEITIPAGTFKAYKIQINGWVGQNRIDNLIWVLPDWGISLKSVRRISFPRGAPIRESLELESFVRGPSSSGAISVSAN